jgi:hypothetical protein
MAWYAVHCPFPVASMFPAALGLWRLSVITSHSQSVSAECAPAAVPSALLSAFIYRGQSRELHHTRGKKITYEYETSPRGATRILSFCPRPTALTCSRPDSGAAAADEGSVWGGMLRCDASCVLLLPLSSSLATPRHAMLSRCCNCN